MLYRVAVRRWVRGQPRTTHYNKQGLIMDKLIEIAKECVASDFIGNDYRDLPKVIFTHEQLHAYTEKVCRPLVEALITADRVIPKGLYGSQAEKEFGFIMKAVADHRTIMGDKK